jgi:phosphoglycerol transferase MdoB-like AlkP superfamily enzyme
MYMLYCIYYTYCILVYLITYIDIHIYVNYIYINVELTLMERFILKELGFAFYSIISDHPHKYLLYYVKVLYIYVCMYVLSYKYTTTVYIDVI